MYKSSSVSHGRIYQIEEVLMDRTLHNASVRITGSLVIYNAETNNAEVRYAGHSITVDTSLLGQFDFRIGSLFQFIGETRVVQGKVLLRARVARNVDGLDMRLYEEALRLRRKFLATVAA